MNMDLLDALHIRQLTDQVKELTLQNEKLKHENEKLEDALSMLLAKYMEHNQLKEKVLSNLNLYDSMNYVSVKDIMNMLRR